MIMASWTGPRRALNRHDHPPGLKKKKQSESFITQTRLLTFREKTSFYLGFPYDHFHISLEPRVQKLIKKQIPPPHTASISILYVTAPSNIQHSNTATQACSFFFQKKHTSQPLLTKHATKNENCIASKRCIIDFVSQLSR